MMDTPPVYSEKETLLVNQPLSEEDKGSDISNEKGTQTYNQNNQTEEKNEQTMCDEVCEFTIILCCAMALMKLFC